MKSLLPVKRLLLSCALFLCLNQTVSAATQNFELSQPVPVMNNQLPDEARMLTTLQLKIQLREKITDYLASLPAFAGFDRQNQLAPMAVLLFPIQVFELSEGHAIKVKTMVDGNLLPQNPAQYLEDNSQALLTVYRHMLYAHSLEQDFSSFMQRLMQASPQQAMQMQMNEGKTLQNRVLSMDLFLQGCESIGLSRWSVAEAQLSQAINLNPTYSVAYFMRGIARIYINAYDKALADFSQDLKLDPQNESGYLLRGITYTIQGALPEQAISDFNHTIELNAQNGQAYFFRGVNYANTKRCDKAEADYNKACNLGYSKACHKECRQEAPHDSFREME